MIEFREQNSPAHMTAEERDLRITMGAARQAERGRAMIAARQAEMERACDFEGFCACCGIRSSQITCPVCAEAALNERRRLHG